MTERSSNADQRPTSNEGTTIGGIRRRMKTTATAEKVFHAVSKYSKTDTGISRKIRQRYRLLPIQTYELQVTSTAADSVTAPVGASSET
jgi:hypothetical protein